MLKVSQFSKCFRCAGEKCIDLRRNYIFEKISLLIFRLLKSYTLSFLHELFLKYITYYSCFYLFSVNSSITAATSHYCWLTTCYTVPLSGFCNRLRFNDNVTRLITRETREKFDFSGVWCLLHATSVTDIIRNLPGCFTDLWELLSSANWASVHTFSLLRPCSLILMMTFFFSLLFFSANSYFCLFSVNSYVTAAVSHHCWLTTCLGSLYLKKKRKSIFQTSHPILKSFD
ncbi:hypothetical protein M9H77_23867 [Catharanthus roseus]|uniref:Uncharacterized protein n=1 Tax=Catharanthus roseus TaxID=4058 RepID=A0ACC0AWN6_CATRO|nr:hypothetical protein M9H77_23867 [Catharanthus roseus]